MDYSPKLKKVMEEIKAIIKKNDIAAVVVMHTPGHGEYLLHLETTYSGASINDGAFRLKGKAEQYGGDAKKRDQVMTDTANMLHILSECTGRMAMNLIDASEITDKVLDADHFSGGHTSHTQQNN